MSNQIEDNGNSWQAWRKLVVHELKRLNENYEGLREDVGNQNVEIAMLKVKAGVWGLLAGLIPVVVTLAILLIKGAL